MPERWNGEHTALGPGGFYFVSPGDEQGVVKVIPAFNFPFCLGFSSGFVDDGPREDILGDVLLGSDYCDSENPRVVLGHFLYERADIFPKAIVIGKSFISQDISLQIGSAGNYIAEREYEGEDSSSVSLNGKNGCRPALGGVVQRT